MVHARVDIGSNPALEGDTRMLLQQFSSAISDILEPQHDEKFLYRFLASRDLDVQKAEKMIRESFKFKKKIEAEDLLKTDYDLPEIAKNYLATKFLCFDKEGSPVRSFLAGICDFKGLAHSLTLVEMMKILIFFLESDLKKAKDNCEKTGKLDEQSIFLIDLQDFNLRQFCDKTVIQAGIQLITMYQDNYPELLKTAYLINAPPYFSWVLNIFKPFIHERTMRKLKVCRTDAWKKELAGLIDKKDLPKYFGGNLDDPESDPKQRVTMNGGMKVPTKYYLKGAMSMKASDPGVQAVTVKERSCFDVKMTIEKPGTTIRWVFQSKDYNVKFGVLFRNANSLKSKKTPPEELVSVDVVESQTMPERGELVCEKAGQYILHFDNSYSWMTPKHLLLKVEEELPKPEIIET